MKNLILYLTAFCFLTITISCEEEFIVPVGGGDPTIELLNNPSSAYFGDSIQYTLRVKDESVDLSTLKVQLLYSEEVVNEKIVRTKTAGEYTVKLFAPFLKNVPNGTARVKFVLENVQLVKEEIFTEIPLSRPDFPFLNLVTEEKTYKMLRKATNVYEVEDDFDQKVRGYIEAPAFGANGNTINFGWNVDKIQEGLVQAIPFSNYSPGNYAIQFNTFTYAASPFVSYKLNGTELSMVDDNTYFVDMELTANQELSFEGIQDLDDWWIDVDFLKEESGKLHFNAIPGKYKITARFDKKYFVIEPMSGDNLASLNADGTGAIWIIGEGIGKPNLSNETGWSPEKALCLAPIGNKKYQITVVGGQQIRTNQINFKFFHQKNWGGEYTNAGISTTSDLIFIGDGQNGRDPGNLGLVAGKQLENGATYVITVDLSAGNNNATLEVLKK